MRFHEALGEVIRDQRQAQNLTLRDVSQTGYVSMGHLSDVENGRKQGSTEFIEAVALALGIETHDLIIDAGYLMRTAKVPDTPESLFSSNPLASAIARL